MPVLLWFTLLLIAVGVGLVAAMLRRDEPVLGMAGLAVLIVAGVPASAYGVLTSV
jgi:hypothetical protein